MFARILSTNDKFSLNVAKKILGEILQLKPDYIEAKELLGSLQKIETLPVRKQENKHE